MDPMTVAIGGLMVAIAAHAIVYFFKTPKESTDELTRRVDSLEDDHHGLELKHVETSTSLIVKMEQLRVEMSELKTALKDLTRSLTLGRIRDDTKA